MSTPNRRDRWLERELRNVPLPEGLIARLKKIGEGSDEQLDAAIRDVRLPAGMLGRLKDIPVDEALERSLCDVDPPVELAERLHAIAAYSNEEIDAGLRDVSLPEGLLRALRSIAAVRRVSDTWRLANVAQWAVAASLLLTIGLSYAGAMVGLMVSSYNAQSAREPALDSSQPVSLDAGSVDETVLASPTLARAERDETPSIAGEFAMQPFPGNPLPRSAIQHFDELFRPEFGGRLDPMDALLLQRHLVAGTLAESLPELEIVRGHAHSWAYVPRVPQFDLPKLLNEGAHPFVDPSQDSALTVSRVPLVASRGSYDRTWRLLREGRLPNAGEVSTEEFLAAVDYEFSPPTTAPLGIRTAAGPSPFGEPELELLQVGVQAGEPLADRRVTHLTLAVDVSAGMAQGDRLGRVREAIARWVGDLGPRDRFSLVAFSEHAEILIEDAARSDAEQAFAVIDSLQPGTSANFAEGLRVASAAAVYAEVDPRVERRVVLLTDGRRDLAAIEPEQLETIAAETAAKGIALDVLAIGQTPVAMESLASLAKAGGGELRRANGAAAIRYALVESLIGQPPVVANQARLTVKFNPNVVARYRLLGHEADAIEALSEGVVVTDLRAGEAATALYELELYRRGGDDVAVAQLTWNDPASGRQNKITQRISRLQFATSLLESPLSLQRAAIAAEAAELLRGSPYTAGHVSGLDRLLEVATHLGPRAIDPSLRRMLTLVDLAGRVRRGKALPDKDDAIWRP